MLLLPSSGGFCCTEEWGRHVMAPLVGAHQAALAANCRCVGLGEMVEEGDKVRSAWHHGALTCHLDLL
jgi:hypothetical protein